MVIRSLGMDKHPFKPRGDDEVILGPEVPYHSNFWALIYLANYNIHDIAFADNLLAKYSTTQTRRH